MKKRTVFWLVGAAIVVVGVLLYAARQGGIDAQGGALPEGEIVTVTTGDLSASANATGHIAARTASNLSLSAPGLVASVPVRVGDTVHAGDALVTLDTTDLALNVAAAEQNLRIQEANLAALQEPAAAADIAAANANLASAQANLDDLRAGAGAEEIAAAQASVQAAQANVWGASSNLSQAQESVTQAQIAAAQAQLAQAQATQKSAQIAYDQNPSSGNQSALTAANDNVAVAQAALDELLQGPNTDAVNGAQANVANAVAQQDAAQAGLDQLLAGATGAQIAAAEAQVAQAQASLDSLNSGPTTEQVQVAEAQVAQARLNLEAAQEALAQATLMAPFDGVITAVYVTEGEFASGRAVSMAATGGMELILSVDEVDVGDLRVGQPAIITLETWPDTRIDSEITAIAPNAAPSNTGLVAYDVHVSLGQTDLPARLGMTANANLITANRENVLLVPNRAIRADRQANKYYVNLVVGETTQEMEVTIGLRDNEYTQITSGLAVGDRLFIGITETPTPQFGPPFGGN